ncbi:MAG: ABC transporter permease subunit [Rhodococcus sp. (in: high G+C Gram-positive bacteria)]
MVVPAVALVVLVAGTGLVTAVLQSLGLMPLVGEPSASFDAFTAQSRDLPTSVLLTLSIAAAATLIGVVIGTLAGAAVASGRRPVAALVAITSTVPHLIGAAAVGLLLADFGFLPRLLGFTEGGWPALVGGPWWVAVVFEYAWKESAFIALVVAGTLATRVAGYGDTATTLGASRWARLRLVTLPLLRPALIASAAISFTYAVGSYEVARLLGRAYPEPLAVMSVRLFTSIDLAVRPQAAAVAVVTTATAGVVSAIALVAMRRSAAWR